MARSESWVLTRLMVFVFILVWVTWRSPVSTSHQRRPKPDPRPLKPRTPRRLFRVSRRPTRPPTRSDLSDAVFTSEKPAWPAARETPRDGWVRLSQRLCRYYGITDEQIHALVGCGGHGRQEYIHASRLKGQACRTKFSVRYGTALYRLKTPARRVGEILSARAEGLSVGAAVRVFGHGEFTIRTRFA